MHKTSTNRRTTKPSAGDVHELNQLIDEVKLCYRRHKLIERFGKRLFKMIPYIPSADVIRVTRKIRKVEPNNQKVIEWSAKCLYAALFFEGEENRKASVRKLFDELVNLSSTGNLEALQHYAMALRYRMYKEPSEESAAFRMWAKALRELAVATPHDALIKSLVVSAS